MARFGLRRTDTRFWSYSDGVHAAYRRWAPVEAALFDFNRFLGKEVFDNTLAGFSGISFPQLFRLFIGRHGNEGFRVQARVPDFQKDSSGNTHRRCLPR